MFKSAVIFQLILLVGAGVKTVSSVHILELDAIDAAVETKQGDINLFPATPPEGPIVLNVDVIGKSRIPQPEYASGLLIKQVPSLYLVIGDQAIPPHSEHTLKIKSNKSRSGRQISLPNKLRVEENTGEESNSLSNQLSNDYSIFENDGSGDGQFENLPDISLVPETPRSQQADISLTPESGYSSSSTLPKTKKNSAIIKNTQEGPSDDFSNTDETGGETTGAINAEERESQDSLSSSNMDENEQNLPTLEDAQSNEASSIEARSNEGDNQRATTVVSTEGKDDIVSDDKLEVSDRPESRSPSGRSLDEASIIPVNRGKVSNETSLNGKDSQTKKVFKKPTNKDDPRQSKNPSTLAVSPKNLPTSGTTFPLFGDGKMVRLMKDNIAVILGVILGLPVFVTTCYLLNHHRSRTGSMDITPATSESAKKRMSGIDDSRTVTCRIENELASCPCEA